MGEPTLNVESAQNYFSLWEWRIVIIAFIFIILLTSLMLTARGLFVNKAETSPWLLTSLNFYLPSIFKHSECLAEECLNECPNVCTQWNWLFPDLHHAGLMMQSPISLWTASCLKTFFIRPLRQFNTFSFKSPSLGRWWRLAMTTTTSRLDSPLIFP